MKKVITINLNGTAYQLEEGGYETLHAYLQQAAAKLQDNPDKDEIVADLEQAVADKCREHLTATKNVVTDDEIKSIIEKMGPVEDAEPDDAAKKPKPEAGAPKRLFKIREGAIFEGVCNGIAAYFDVDVTLVRVAFIVLTILTGGAWIAAYILMAIFVPEARTAEDRATAQGQPFNAQAIIDSARDRYEYWKKFGDEQKSYWKSHKQEIKHDIKHQIKQQKATQYGPSPEQIEEWNSYGINVKGAGRGFAGLLGGLGVLVLIALGGSWLVGVFFALTHGAVLGYFAGVPKIWLVVLLTSIFYAVFLPIQGASNSALWYAKNLSRKPSFWAAFAAVLVWLVSIAVIIALATNVPHVSDGFTKLTNDIIHAIGR